MYNMMSVSCTVMFTTLVSLGLLKKNAEGTKEAKYPTLRESVQAEILKLLVFFQTTVKDPKNMCFTIIYDI